MSKKELIIEKKNLYFIAGIVLVLALILVLVFSPSSQNQRFKSETLKTENIEGTYERFLVLSEGKTNFCAGPNIVEKVDSERLQGSCCSPMDFHRYEEQIESLKKYSDYKVIPTDPYDVSKEWAKEFIEFYDTKLTDEQQKIYDEAVEVSHEGGPCCCKCWHWYAYGGLAKHLIINENFTSEQIAEVWDISDACGGSGHEHGH